MSPLGLGCVKTPTSNFRVERLSRLRRIRKEPSGGHHRQKKSEKTILRILRVCTFSHSLGQKRRFDRSPATIAVGTRVTSRPPHRSVRAQFGHTAPTLGV